ncbi:MAG: hypothetical protein WCT06_03340 [Armatimonadota bacterium]|jgi:hypothetical protein
MFKRAVIVVPLFIAAAYLSGCRTESVPVKPDRQAVQVVIPKGISPRADALPPDSGAKMQAERTEPPLPEALSGAAAEVAKRIQDNRTGWENSEQAAPVARSPRLDEENNFNAYEVSSISPEIMAAEKKFSALRLNLQIRIRLLESRIAYAGESERRILTEKLNKARAEQEFVEEEYRAEIERVSTPPKM